MEPPNTAAAAGAQPLRAVLFDLDGTLIDTKRLYYESYRRALLPVLGREITDEEIVRVKPRSETYFLRQTLQGETLEACLRDLYAAYEELHPTHFDGVFPGVRELLDAVRAAGLRTGIVTGKSRTAYAITMRYAELGEFDVVVHDDDVSAPKPDPAGILMALEQIGVAPAEAVYVGDNLSDVEAAVAAGTRAAGVLWGRTDPAQREQFAARVREAGGEPFATPEALRAALLPELRPPARAV